MVFFATVGATGYLFVVIPKGFFPQQDTGILFRQLPTPRRTFRSTRWIALQQEARRDHAGRSGRRHVAMALGAGVGAAAQNNGSMFITLKPRDERDVDAFQIIDRLRPSSPRSRASALPAGRRRTSRSARAPHATQFQYTLQDANFDELNDLGAAAFSPSSNNCRNCATSRPTSRRRHDADDRRSTATWPRASAFSRS